MDIFKLPVFPAADCFPMIKQGKLKNASRRKAKLLVTRPDLAEQVDAETMKLEDAVKKESDDLEARRVLEWAETKNLITGLNMFAREPEYAAAAVLLFNKSVAETEGVEVTPELVRQSAAYLTAYATAMENPNETPTPSWIEWEKRFNRVAREAFKDDPSDQPAAP